MIEKKDGIINEIVYDNTVYHNGEYRIYQSLPSLINVLEEIIKANVTTESLGITPFYRSACKKGQVEFDNKMFYLECRDEVSENEYLTFMEECCDEGEEISEDIKKRFYLCKSNDFITFSESIKKYIDYLDILIPQMADTLKSEYNFTQDQLLFGYFCFSIDSE